MDEKHLEPIILKPELVLGPCYYPKWDLIVNNYFCNVDQPSVLWVQFNFNLPKNLITNLYDYFKIKEEYFGDKIFSGDLREYYDIK